MFKTGPLEILYTATNGNINDAVDALMDGARAKPAVIIARTTRLMAVEMEVYGTTTLTARIGKVAGAR